MPNLGAKGTQLEVFNRSSWRSVARIRELAGPSARKDFRELTGPHHRRTGWRVYRPALRDGGDVTLEANYDPAEASHGFAEGEEGVIALLEAPGPQLWRIIFPDAASTTVTFDAGVAFFETSAPSAGRLGFFATLKVSGRPVWS